MISTAILAIDAAPAHGQCVRPQRQRAALLLVRQNPRPGYRCYVVAGKHHARVEHLKLLGTVATAGLPQLTIAHYLKSNKYEAMIRTATCTYAQRSEQLQRLILEHSPEGTRVTQPQGGFVLGVELTSTSMPCNCTKQPCAKRSPSPRRHLLAAR